MALTGAALPSFVTSRRRRPLDSAIAATANTIVCPVRGPRHVA